MRDLRGLIERVDKEGASYDLDVTIAQTLVPQIVVLRQRNDNSGVDPHTYRCFTTKVDDAIWLSSVLLPGNYREITGPRKYLNIPTPVPGKFLAQLTTDAGIKSYRSIGWGETEAIALLLATLRALEAQGGGE